MPENPPCRACGCWWMAHREFLEPALCKSCAVAQAYGMTRDNPAAVPQTEEGRAALEAILAADEVALGGE